MTDAELIERIAVEVMGWDLKDQENYYAYWNHPEYGARYYKKDWNPLADANHWMMVVEKLKDYTVDLIRFRGQWKAIFTQHISGEAFSVNRNKFLGHAVCLAALEAVRSGVAVVEE